MREWFSIETATKWGDYWSILIGGMTGQRKGDQLQLERTGPFVPPMVVSGMSDLVVTESMRRVLEPLPGVAGFRSVIKERIVRLDWSKWELSTETREILQFREPEDTVLSGQHDAALAKEIGELYEVLLEFDGMIRLDYDAEGMPNDSFSRAPTRQFDVFKAATRGGDGVVIGSSRFVSQLPHDCTRWLELNPVTIGEATDEDDEDWT